MRVDARFGNASVLVTLPAEEPSHPRSGLPSRPPARAASTGNLPGLHRIHREQRLSAPLLDDPDSNRLADRPDRNQRRQAENLRGPPRPKRGRGRRRIHQAGLEHARLPGRKALPASWPCWRRLPNCSQRNIPGQYPPHPTRRLRPWGLGWRLSHLAGLYRIHGKQRSHAPIRHDQDSTGMARHRDRNRERLKVATIPTVGRSVKIRQVAGRPLIGLCTLVLMGVSAFLVVDRPWAGMSGTQAAHQLEQRLRSTTGAQTIGLSHTITDRYTCSADPGAPVPGEPDWTYECSDATDSQGPGFFVLARGDKLAQIQPSG